VENPRLYGERPNVVVLVHGGPGAPGTMAPVARELSSQWGVVEPLQTADSLEGQVRELRDAIMTHADPPVTLIGSSWGAMLSFIVAARHPELVRKLILIGSGVFETQYAVGIDPERMRRLTPEDRQELDRLTAMMSDPDVDKNEIFAAMGHVFTKTDALDPITLDTEMIEGQFNIFQRVWNEAAAYRASGDFVALGRNIRCPVVAIHGDYDPHPVEGVRDPLSRVLSDFRFILLEECGHLPWIERRARERFFEILRDEIAS